MLNPLGVVCRTWKGRGDGRDGGKERRGAGRRGEVGVVRGGGDGEWRWGGGGGLRERKRKEWRENMSLQPMVNL